MFVNVTNKKRAPYKRMLVAIPLIKPRANTRTIPSIWMT